MAITFHFVATTFHYIVQNVSDLVTDFYLLKYSNC